MFSSVATDFGSWTRRSVSFAVETIDKTVYARVMQFPILCKNDRAGGIE